MKFYRLLLDGAPLIAIHEGRYYKKPDGLALGPGAFVKGLEYSANVKAEVIGKPTAGFFKAALGDTVPSEAVMIGDVNTLISYYSLLMAKNKEIIFTLKLLIFKLKFCFKDVKDDIAGAQTVGIRGFLVKTGKYRAGDEKTIEPVPNTVCDSFPAAVDMILQNIV